MIYLAVTGCKKFAKIGFSKNPQTRIAQLQDGLPENFSHYEFRHGSINLEKEIHRELDNFRSKGEWFFMCNEVRFKFRRTPEPIFGWGEYKIPKLDSEYRSLFFGLGASNKAIFSKSLLKVSEFKKGNSEALTGKEKAEIAYEIIHSKKTPILLNGTNFLENDVNTKSFAKGTRKVLSDHLSPKA